MGCSVSTALLFKCGGDLWLASASGLGVFARQGQSACVWPLMAFMCTFSGCVSEAEQKDVLAQTEMELSGGFRGDG